METVLWFKVASKKLKKHGLELTTKVSDTFGCLFSCVSKIASPLPSPLKTGILLLTLKFAWTTTIVL